MTELDVHKFDKNLTHERKYVALYHKGKGTTSERGQATRDYREYYDSIG